MKAIVGIADTPEDADSNAWSAREHEARRQTMAKLIAGHAVEIVWDNNASGVIKLQVGDCVFSDARDAYPSAMLVAQIALAVDASKFNPDAFKIADFDKEDLQRFEPGELGNKASQRRWKVDELDMTAECNARREATKRGKRPLSEFEQRYTGPVR